MPSAGSIRILGQYWCAVFQVRAGERDSISDPGIAHHFTVEAFAKSLLIALGISFGRQTKAFLLLNVIGVARHHLDGEIVQDTALERLASPGKELLSAR